MDILTSEQIDEMSRTEKHKALTYFTAVVLCDPDLSVFERILVYSRINYILRKLGASTHDDIELFGGSGDD